jgi:peptide/nickel transport system substrate-binding protein
VNINAKKIGKYLFYGVFVIVFLWVVNALFLQFDFSFSDAKDQEMEKAELLRVIFPENIDSLDPAAIDPATRQRLVNIYEPLVRPDVDLKMKPALALSWGLIDDTTWEFKLRPDVKFHDDTEFDTDDVVASLAYALADKDSELASLLSTLEKIEDLGGGTFYIKTTEPDPLLLQKLSLLLIVPSEWEENALPSGTGAYRLADEQSGGSLMLESFDEYWGNGGRFESVEVISEPDKVKRVQMLMNDDADFLSFVPYDAVDILLEKGFEMAMVPSLEVQFLVFNFDRPLMQDLNVRKAISLMIDPSYLVEAVGGYARTVSQFVSNGIFGFSPDIEKHEFDPDKAKELAGKIKDKTLQVHLSQGLELLGEHVRTQLKILEVNAVVSYLDNVKLLQSMQNGDADIYFLGLKADLGDSSAFFEDVAYSSGIFNIANYDNARVDELIEMSRDEMDAEARRDILQEAMEIVVEKDVFGVPLFEYETVYGFKSELEIEPRVDGAIYFNDIKLK